MQGDIREAKKLMAYEVTKLIHGEENAKMAQKTAEEVFGGGLSSAAMPTVKLDKKDKINVCDMLVLAKIVASKGEARRLIEQNGLSLGDEKVTDFNKEIEGHGEIVVHKGKKVHVKVVFE